MTKETPTVKGRKIVVNVVDRRDHSAFMLRLISKGNLPAYIEECKRECSGTPHRKEA